MSITAANQLTEKMKEYEKVTGKKAIWHGSITEGFKKWQRGEEIYGIDKKGIGVLVSDELKSQWQKFADENDFPTISKLIRESVNFYIDFHLKRRSLNNYSKISHALKEPLTAIQGFSQLIIENEGYDLNPNTLIKIKEIYSQSLYLEKKINQLINEMEPEILQYDILIIEDDSATIMVLENFFESKGYNCFSVMSGEKGLEELHRSKPKVILLDIILPFLNGYDVCKKIKSDDHLKDIPVYYITAIPEVEVRKKLEETGADGYFLKPFKFNQFKSVIDDLE